LNEKWHSAGDPAPSGVDDLVVTIGAQLGAVEETVPFGERFKDVIIVKIVSVADHPDADRLHVCKVDDGRAVTDVDRDENGLVQIVCGAPNVREGMLAAWLPPTATVPSTYGTGEPFVLSARPLRGVVSNGMMASPKELTLGDSHEGILEIVPDADEVIEPGTRFAAAYHLDGDVIIDMENKMFTHRPDCFGWLGIAREIEGIQQRAYKSPEWYRTDAPIPDMETEELPLDVQNELPGDVPRFTAITMRNVQVKPSPVWLQVDLARAGLRPINNIVDFTNYFMLLTGQPLHAYDYDKVRAISGEGTARLVVRKPRAGEKITLLNGKEIEPRADAIMIATDQQLIGVGGVMGGGDTEVDDTTTNIILECATFDMYSIRRTSMAHGLFTDAVTRFNKGQSPLQNRAVIVRIVDEIRRHAGGKVAGQLIDVNNLPTEVQDRGSLYAPVTVTTAFINDRLGWDLSADVMRGLLANVEFQVTADGESLTITAPFWRTDIEIPEDIVEEIGRLYGYDHLHMELPQHDLTPAPKNPSLQLKVAIRDALADAGANEVLTYSFVHGNLVDKAGQNRELAFQLSNALSPDLQYYRLSLTPSLLDRVHANIKSGHEQFALFEIGKAHIVGVEEDDLPKELERVALVWTASDKAAAGLPGAPYYQARAYLQRLLQVLGFGDRVRFEPLTDTNDQATTYYAAGRAATVMLDDHIIGRIGEYTASVRKALKLPTATAGFELGITTLLDATRQAAYTALPRFPRVEQDICLKVPADTPYAEVYDFVASHLDGNRPDKTHHTLTPLDIYQRDDDPDHKQITLRLQIASFERTLTDDEISALLTNVAEAAAHTLRAERV
jgi:phenylalanyl-tRNA synthetase beta chain